MFLKDEGGRHCGPGAQGGKTKPDTCLGQAYPYPVSPHHPRTGEKQAHSSWRQAASAAEPPLNSPGVQFHTCAEVSQNNKPIFLLITLSPHFYPLFSIAGSPSKKKHLRPLSVCPWLCQSQLSHPPLHQLPTASSSYALSLQTINRKTSSHLLTLRCFSSPRGDPSHPFCWDSWKKLNFLSPYDFSPLHPHPHSCRFDAPSPQDTPGLQQESTLTTPPEATLLGASGGVF